MGLKFGNLGVKVNGLVTYTVSPFEQRAGAGMISKGVPNMVRRFAGQVFRVVPPFIVAYLIYDWGENYNRVVFRKNPKDFENDE